MEPIVVALIKDRISELSSKKPNRKIRRELVSKRLIIGSYEKLKKLGITDLGNLDFHDLKRISN